LKFVETHLRGAFSIEIDFQNEGALIPSSPPH